MEWFVIKHLNVCCNVSRLITTSYLLGRNKFTSFYFALIPMHKIHLNAKTSVWFIRKVRPLLLVDFHVHWQSIHCLIPTYVVL